MTVPYIALLYYIGGPHDGHQRREENLELLPGDVVTCPCHHAVYAFRGRDSRGFDIVEYDPTLRSVTSEVERVTA